MTVQTIAPVRKEITVEVPRERAFTFFTTKMGTWWMPSHHIGSRPYVDVVIEPRVDGRWYEKDDEGTECQWGHVLVWEPGERVVLAWQLDASYTFVPELVTEVEVRFVEVGPSSTRVELEHRHLERMGEAATQMQVVFDSPNGWNGLLARFGELV